MRFIRRRRDEPAAADGSQLIDEVAGFLRGDASSFFESGQTAPPPWARLNVLAHGDVETLRRLAARDSATVRRNEGPSWGRTLSYLSGKILLCCSDTGTSLLDMQRRALIPLELQLGDEPIGPPTLVRLVITAIEQTRVRDG